MTCNTQHVLSSQHSHLHYGLLLRWVKAGFNCGQACTVQTTCHRKFMVYFVDKKSTIGFVLYPVIVLWLMM